MRIAGLLAAFLLSGCAAARPLPTDLTPTTVPSVELILWCEQFPDTCRREAADTAHAQCRAAGRKARFVLSQLLQRHVAHGQEGYFLYDCVR